jgi:hypothetical protein
MVRGMSAGHWFRMYDDMLDNPKAQRLPAPLFKLWVNLLALASKNGGRIPPAMEDVAFALRVSEAEAARTLETLHAKRLMDKDETGYYPHDWNDRQFLSDVSTERVKRFRQRSKKHEGTVSETPDETAPDTDSEAETEQKEPLTSFAESRDAETEPDLEAELPPHNDRRRGTALPENFPDEPALMRAIAFWNERGRLDLSHSVRDQAEQFRAHHIAKGTRSKSWAASWRLWIGNALEFNRNKANGNATEARRNPHDSFLTGIASGIAKREAAVRESEGDWGDAGPTGPALLPGGLRTGTG